MEVSDKLLLPDKMKKRLLCVFQYLKTSYPAIKIIKYSASQKILQYERVQYMQ